MHTFEFKLNDLIEIVRSNAINTKKFKKDKLF